MKMITVIELTGILCMLSLTGSMVYVTSQYRSSPNSTKSSLNLPEFIKDPVTRCQYISANGAMYPRLDAKRTHICSDANIYKFETEGNPS